MARKPTLSTRLAGPTPSGTAKQFASVYGGPQRIKAGIASGALNAGPGLAQAQAKRQNLAQGLLSKPGARQGLFDAYGPGFHPGDLRAALRTVHSAHQMVASGQHGAELLASPLYQRAKQTADRLLGIRKTYLQNRYTA
jgi:hypothetical protein